MISYQSLRHKLRSISEQRNMPFNVCWKQLLLERFLARLAASEHSSQFILKGGLLLSYIMKIGRETVDVDFLLTRIKSEEKELRKIFDQICRIHSLDGFTFIFDSIELLQQPHMEYAGYRIILKARFANTKDKIQIDVGIGDIVDPLILEIPLIKHQGKPFFESSLSLHAYPTETIFSEKLETVLRKGAINSRMKDYHDLILLIRSDGMINKNTLQAAIHRTFVHRGTTLKTINFDVADLKTLQKLWADHLRNIGDFAEELELPKDISIVINEINHYLSELRAS